MKVCGSVHDSTILTSLYLACSIKVEQPTTSLIPILCVSYLYSALDTEFAMVLFLHCNFFTFPVSI